MALGAGLISWGVNQGIIAMGTDIVAINVESIVGAVGGSSIGAIAGSYVGAIGIVAGGGAIGIPALAVIGGSSLILGLAGYTTGDIVHKFFNTATFDVSRIMTSGALIAIGLGLFLDGGRRLIKDKKVTHLISEFKNKIIYLKKLTVDIIASSVEELKLLIRDFDYNSNSLLASVFASGAGAYIGAIGGGSIATSSVVLAGSHTLGGLALSIGLVSAPIWPVILGGVIGLSVSYTAWKAAKQLI